MKRSFLFALAIAITACSTMPPQVTVTSEVTVTLQPASPTPEATVTPEPAITLTSEPREFVPANTIEFTETLSGYELELAKDADLKAIYWDIAVSHLMDTQSTSEEMKFNRAIYQEIIKDHPEWKGISHSAEAEVKLAYMQEFLKRSGGKMIVTDMNYNKYEADFNKPVKFEVIQVDELPKGYTGMRALLGGNDTNGGGGSMYTLENGQIVYSLAIMPESIELYKTSGRKNAGVYISEFFAQFRNGTASHSNTTWFKNDATQYKLYIRGNNINQDIVNRSTDFGFIELKKVGWTFIVQK